MFFLLSLSVAIEGLASHAWCNDLSVGFLFLLADEVTFFLSLYTINVSSAPVSTLMILQQKKVHKLKKI